MIIENFKPTRSPMAWLFRYITLLLTYVVPSFCFAASSAVECNDLFENKKITLVVPYAPGGGFDRYARVFQPVLEKQTGSQVLVRNIAGADGLIGVRTVIDARTDSLVIGVFNPLSLISFVQIEKEMPDVSEFIALGSFIQDHGVMVGKKDADFWSDDSSTKVIGADSEILRMLMTTGSLGWKSDLVRGYSGTAERWLALLRGDIDLMFGGGSSMRTFLSTAEEVKPVLTITDTQVSEFPGTPFLAGSGGIIDRLTRDLSAAEREERMQMAHLAVSFSIDPRMIAVSSRISPEARACLGVAVESALFSAEAYDAFLNQNIDFSPSTGPEIQFFVDSVFGNFNQNADWINQLITESKL